MIRHFPPFTAHSYSVKLVRVIKETVNNCVVMGSHYFVKAVQKAQTSTS